MSARKLIYEIADNETLGAGASAPVGSNTELAGYGAVWAIEALAELEALEAKGWRFVPPGTDGETITREQNP